MVLEFDHVLPGKTANVVALARRGVAEARVAEEIALCEVRCANCHRRRTILERGGYRLAPPKL